MTALAARQPLATVAAFAVFRSCRAHEDLVSITSQLAGGKVTNHLVNWLSAMKERVTVITGEKGTLGADSLTADLTVFGSRGHPHRIERGGPLPRLTEGNMTRYAYPRPAPRRVEQETFRDALLGKDAEAVTLKQAAATVSVANAAAESALTGRMVVVVTSKLEGK